MNRTGIEWTYYSWNPITGCESCFAGWQTHRGISMKPEEICLLIKGKFDCWCDTAKGYCDLVTKLAEDSA